MSDPKTNKEWALYYLSKGFSIIPVGKNINNKNDKKMPLISSWLDYQKRKPTIEEVTNWWTKWPDGKIAIICGKISNLVVVDIDNTAEFIKLGIRLPHTPTVKTVKGWHYYFLLSDNQKKIVLKNNDIHYGEIQADGSYVIAPPSKHHNEIGNEDGEYSWSLSLEDIPLAELDISIFEKIIGKYKKTDVLTIARGVLDGDRNNAMVALIGSLLLYHPESDWDKKVWPSIVACNNANTPSLENNVLETAYRNICKRESDKRKDIKEMFKQQKSKKQAMYQLSNTIIEDNFIKTIDDDKPEIRIYENGCYIAGESRIENIIITTLEECVTRADISEMLNKIRIQTYIKREDFDNNKNNLNLLNGVFNLKTKQFTDHNPDYLFLNMIPVLYNPEAKCPLIKKFLLDILSPEQITIMQEWFGFCLYRQHIIKKAMILVGEKNTGKTTLIRLLSSFLGKDNIAGISLQSLASDKFAVGQLYGRYANIYDDLSFKDIGDNGKFKIATGGGYSTGEYKFGNQFNFENYAKLIFACNKIPNIKDASDDAYFDRWIIMRFDNTVEKKDPVIIEKMTTENELSGLLNWALEGLYRVFNNYEFSYTKTSTEIKTEMLSSGSSIASFAYNELEESVGNKMTKEVMYNDYCQYCHQQNMAIETIEMLGRKLPASAPYVRQGRIESKTCWLNIRLKNNNQDDRPVDPESIDWTNK